MPVVVLGTLALAGYVTVRRALASTVSETDLDPAIDITVIEAAVEENGLQAVTETETLEAAINDDELDAPIDTERLRSAVEENLAAVETALETGDIDAVLADEDLDTGATDRALSAIEDQEIVESTLDDGEIGVSVDLDELRSALDSGTAAIERTTTTLAETLTDENGPALGEDRRIAVISDHGSLESLIGGEEAPPDDAQSIEIETPDDRTDDSDSDGN